MTGFQGLGSSAGSDINYQDLRWSGVHSDLGDRKGKGLVRVVFGLGVFRLLRLPGLV